MISSISSHGSGYCSHAVLDSLADRPPDAGREKVKVFGAWLDADIAGRKAGQGNRAAGLIARAERGEVLADKEKAEVRSAPGFNVDQYTA